MSTAPLPREEHLVTVEGTVMPATGGMIALINGSGAHRIPRRYVHIITPHQIKVPDWYAAETGLVTAETCVTIAELATRFGVRREWVTAHLHQLIDRDGFPRPVTTIGQKRWDRASVDAWFSRYHPDRPAPAASMHDEDDDETIRQQLAAAYGGRR